MDAAGLPLSVHKLKAKMHIADCDLHVEPQDVMMSRCRCQLNHMAKSSGQTASRSERTSLTLRSSGDARVIIMMTASVRSPPKLIDSMSVSIAPSLEDLGASCSQAQALRSVSG